jgi:hypothetical protein
MNSPLFLGLQEEVFVSSVLPNHSTKELRPIPLGTFASSYSRALKDGGVEELRRENNKALTNDVIRYKYPAMAYVA